MNIILCRVRHVIVDDTFDVLDICTVTRCTISLIGVDSGKLLLLLLSKIGYLSTADIMARHL